MAGLRGDWLLPVVGGFVAVMCAGGLWFAYTSLRGGGGGEPPLIRADQTAIKVKPDQPGGDAAPGQDKDVYNMGQQAPTVERLLPPPEQAMAKPVQEEPPPAPAPVTQAAPPPAQTPAPAATPAPPPAPKPAPVAVPPPKPAPTQTTAPPTVLTAPTQTAARPPSAATPSAAGPGFRLQIAATKDEDKAHAEWHRLQNAHPDLLGSLGMSVVKADLGDKGIFYRVQAGPIPEKVDADKLCGQLKAVSIGCIVVRAP